MTDDDRRILEFADRWWRNAGTAETAIKDELGLSPVRFYQRLNHLLDNPDVLAEQPVLVRRLCRIRDQRATRRRA